MNTAGNRGQDLTPALVRDTLDEILAQEITALLDVDSVSAMLSFNLASIACVTVAIEREREIKQYKDFPPERYTRESFVNELIDIGLEADDALETAVASVLSRGYISTQSNGDLKAEMPAFMMVGFLDSMFPGMLGMNLVAFVLQMNEEVNSGRKSLELAVQSFKSTLKSRGQSVSKDRAEKTASEIVSGNVAVSKPSAKISQKLKQDNVNRLSKLIKKRRQRPLDASDRFKVKDVFDTETSQNKPDPEQLDPQKAEEAIQKVNALARELEQKEEKIQKAEQAAKETARQLEELELREKKLLEAQKQALAAKEKAAQVEAREARMAEKERQLKALEDRLKHEQDQKQQAEADLRQEPVQQKKTREVSQADDDVESRIAEFESELAMPCPVCKKGEVISKTTQKGKTFFSCTRSDCRFVSWDKPYYFECPLCKNSFLIEMTTSAGEKGLKCPRASCSYSQNNVFDPKQNMAQAMAASAPKKKKRLVRRRKRR